jgi:spore photoproduct lyase
MRTKVVVKSRVELVPEPLRKGARVYGDGVIRWFDKTPPGIVCPHFWELNWAYGCWFDCAYCYLQGTLRGNKKPRHRPVGEVLAALDSFFREQDEPQILNSGELADSMVFPQVIKRISDKFEEQGKHKLLVLTKSANIGVLLDRPRRQTVFSFSLNAPEVWRLWEHRTPPPEARIRAAKAAYELGDEVRVRIDPIFPIEGWREAYENLVYELLSELTPERVTLGTPRGLAKTLMYARDRSWAAVFRGGEKTGWGWKVAPGVRAEVYGFLYDKLVELGVDKGKIALCKETEEMWRRLGLDPRSIRCNCVW